MEPVIISNDLHVGQSAQAIRALSPALVSSSVSLDTWKVNLDHVMRLNCSFLFWQLGEPIDTSNDAEFDAKLNAIKNLVDVAELLRPVRQLNAI